MRRFEPSSEHVAKLQDGEPALLARVAAGDRGEPLIELYERYARPVYRLALRMTGDRHHAEEVVQETFLRLWRSAAGFDATQSSVRSFVFLLARRVTIDFHRRASARPPAVSDDAEATEALTTVPAGDDDMDRLLTGLEVRAALETLSDKHREVLHLGYDEGLSQSQIARRLEVPLGTVKTRTFHALRELRHECDRRGLHA